MKRYAILIVGITLAVCCVCAGNAYSADKIGYVDVNQVFDQYGKTKEYDDALAKKQDVYEQERTARLQKIQDAQGKLSLLKEDERNKLQQQIDKDKGDLLQFDRQQQTELKRERDEKLKEILLTIERVVREYAEKEQYTLILNDKVLIYGTKALDITDTIIKRMNELAPSDKK